MVLLVKETVTVKLFNHLPMLSWNVMEFGLSRNYTGTFDHVSHLKSFCSTPWISWEKQSICESVSAQTLPCKTRYLSHSRRTWKIWKVGSNKHLKSKCNPGDLKLLNIFQHWTGDACYLFTQVPALHCSCSLCESSCVHYFTLLGETAKQEVNPFLPSFHYLLGDQTLVLFFSPWGVLFLLFHFCPSVRL